MIVPASQLLPAGGTVAVEPDTLGQAVGAEDVSACGGQEMVAWVGRSSSGSNQMRVLPLLLREVRDSMQTGHWMLETEVLEGGTGEQPGLIMF